MASVCPDTAPFPAAEDQRLRLRRFGAAGEDLGVDFTTAPPQVISDVLTRCTLASGPAPDPGFFWELPVAQRVEAVLVLAGLHAPAPLTVPMRCPRSACWQPMEIELTIAELLDFARSVSDAPVVVVPLDGCQVALRRPTGEDQRTWLRQTFADEEQARQSLIRTLLVEGADVELTPERVAAIESAMGEFDPLVQFRLTAVCPHCGAGSPHDIDLTAFALERLRTAQAQLLHAVHRLARCYHWSEAEILALPAWRRERYLALLDREES